MGYDACFAFDQATDRSNTRQNMKYSILCTTLSLALGGGLAMAANEPADPYGSQPAQQQQKPAQQQPAPMEDQASLEARLNAIQSVDLLFDTNSAQLKPGAFDQLKTLAQWA